MHSMQHTRWEILQFLKRKTSGTVEEFASALSLAPMTVRQHLAVLEREGLISHTEQRKGPGRPSYIFALSTQAEDLFPKGYDKLAERLLQELSSLQSEEISGLSEEGKIDYIMRRMAERVANDYSYEIRGITIEERGPEVIALLREHEGTLSEWIHAEDGFHIEDINCPYQRVAKEEPSLCTWHVSLLSHMLKTGIEVEQCMATGDTSCLYHVTVGGESGEQQMKLPLSPTPLAS